MSLLSVYPRNRTRITLVVWKVLIRFSVCFEFLCFGYSWKFHLFMASENVLILFYIKKKLFNRDDKLVLFNTIIGESAYIHKYVKSYIMIVINLSVTQLSRKIFMQVPEDVHTFIDDFPLWHYVIVVIILCYKQISAFCLSCLIDSFANVWRCFLICIKEWE